MMAQADERIRYYASLCEQLYNPTSSEEQFQVQQELEKEFPTFTAQQQQQHQHNRKDSNTSNNSASSPTGSSLIIQTPTETASALRILLEQSPTPYVQTFCLARLKQLITSQFTIFDTITKLQLRTFLLEYAFLHPNMLPFIVSQLASVLTQLTRMGWVELEEYRHIEEDMDQFLQASMDHRILGLHLLSVIIQDINTISSPRYAAIFRKAASGFRDTQLLGIFKMSFRTLEEILAHTIHFEKVDQEDRLRENTLRVLVNCLSYDFAGISLDEAGEDVGTVQVPTTWRSTFEQDHFVTTFFRAYQQFSPPHSSKVMQCLVLLASTRKALFTGDLERSAFVARLMQGIQSIIVQSQGMNDTDNYNEFCRLLFRFRAIAPLNELAKEPGYEEWITLVADFTIKAFQSWKWSPNTSIYLLGFWSRTVETMSYSQQLDESTSKKIESITVEVVRTYILTNVQSVPTRIEEMLDDPLENESSIVETLQMLGQIARCQYQESSATLLSAFDPIAMEYQECIQSAGFLQDTLDVIETKFAWLVYFAAVFVGKRPAYLSSEEMDDIDGKITTKVLQLMQVNQALLQEQQGTMFLNSRLDAAFIYFFQQFRKSYIGESAKAVYNSLTEAFGISDQIDMLDVMVRKIVTNLQFWGHNESLIRQTLELFNDLAGGYSALKNLRKTETTRYLLQNHLNNSHQYHGFFGVDEQDASRHRHNRMLYQQILAKILFAEEVTPLEFDTFMKGFEQRLDGLAPLNTIHAFRQPPVKRALQDIFRDLRGLMMALQSRRHFALFFDWFYPDYMPIVLRGMEAWTHDTMVTTALLKFMAEFVHNKNQRLNFDVSSPNGILMFKDASQLVRIYGRHALEKSVIQEDRKYQDKYKGISICFQILTRCLNGKYINFGVFYLYQDKTVEQTFQMMFQLMLDIPLEDLMDFPKLTKAYFQLLDEFSLEQLRSLPAVTAEPFLSILDACEQGVQVPDPHIRTHACSTLDHVFTMIVEETEKCQGPFTTKQHRRHQQQQQHRASYPSDYSTSSSSSSSSTSISVLRRSSSSSATSVDSNSIPMISTSIPNVTNNITTNNSSNNNSNNATIGVNSSNINNTLMKSPLLSSSTSSGTSSSITNYSPHWCLDHIQGSPHLLESLLVTLFGLILFDDNNDHWQLSRPLYVLTLIQKENATKYTNHVIQHQLPERREFVAKALNQLMEGIGWTIAKKDRERFSQNVLAFKRELNMNQATLTPLSISTTRVL